MVMKKINRILAACMGAVMVITSIPASVSNAEEKKSVSTQQEVKIQGKAEILSAQATYIEENESESQLTFLMDDILGAPAEEVYYVTEKLDAFYGSLLQADTCTQMRFEMRDGKGNLLESGEIPCQEQWSFSSGMVLGVNIASVEAVQRDGSVLRASITLFNTEPSNMDSLELDERDEDQDGLNQYLESFYGTDPAKADSDGDGLSDYEEIFKTGTSPLQADSDGNKVADGEEDPDQDGLGSLEEIVFGSDPICADSDNDGLSDQEERQAGTNPQQPDSDDDGLTDGKEIEFGMDPLNSDTDQDGILDADETITAKCQTQEERESRWMQPSVTIEAPASQAASVEIRPVEDSMFLNASLPGYLGSAVDFSMDGAFDSAELTFELDTSFMEEQIDPAVYYFNEDTQTLERVLEQSFDGKTLRAAVTHFSKYIVVDETQYLGESSGYEEGLFLDRTDSDGDGLYDAVENYGILLGTGAKLYTMSNREDTDRDGLRDGEELTPVYGDRGEITYFMLKSNPTMEDTDFDGYEDERESQAGTSSLLYTLEGESYVRLINDSQYESAAYAGRYHESGTIIDIAMKTSGQFDNVSLYKEALYDFLKDYNEEIQDYEKRQAMLRLMGNVTDSAVDIYEAYEENCLDQASSIKSVLEALENIKEALQEAKRRSTYQQVLSCYGEQVGELEKLMALSAAYSGADVDKMIRIEMKELSSAMWKPITYLQKIESFQEIGRRYAEINANASLIQKNVSILDAIIQKSENRELAQAAALLRSAAYSEISRSAQMQLDLWKQLGSDLTESAVSGLLDALLAATGYGVLAEAYQAVVGFLLDAVGREARNSMTCVALADAGIALAAVIRESGQFVGRAEFCDGTDEGLQQLYLLSCLRKAAEKQRRDKMSASRTVEQNCTDNIGWIDDYQSTASGALLNFASVWQGICGRVTDENGLGIAQATVTAYSGGRAVAKDQTSQGGSYRLSLSDGSYTIQIEKNGYQTLASQTLTVSQQDRQVVADVQMNQEEEVSEEDLYYTNNVVTSDYFMAQILDNRYLQGVGLTAIPGVVKTFVQVGDAQGEVFASQGNQYGVQVDLQGLSDGVYPVKVFYSTDGTTAFTSASPDIYITRENGDWKFSQDALYKNNQEKMRELENKNPQSYLSLLELRMTEAERSVLKNLTDDLVEDASTDYEVCQAIYQWVTRNIAYNEDQLAQNQSGTLDVNTQRPYAVYTEKSAICQGYTELTQAMLRLAGIPCEFVRGAGRKGLLLEDPATFREDEHSWVAAYITDSENGNRWILMDTTWGAGKRIRNGKMVYENGFSESYPCTTYFLDQSLQAFSSSHYIMGYGMYVTSGRMTQQALETRENKAALPFEIVTDKASYESGDAFTVRVSFTNTGSQPVEDLELRVTLPQRMQADDPSALKKHIQRLNPGEKLLLEVTGRIKTESTQETQSETQEQKPQEKPTGQTSSSSHSQPEAKAKPVLNKKKLVLIKGRTYRLKVRRNAKKVTWKSSRKNVASVSKKGVVKAKKKGSCIITATLKGGKKLRCKVRVVNLVRTKKIRLQKKKATVQAGKQLKLKAVRKPKGANDALKWKSSNKKVAVVSQKGVIKAKKKGKTLITVRTSSGKKASCILIVKKKQEGKKDQTDQQRPQNIPGDEKHQNPSENENGSNTSQTERPQETERPEETEKPQETEETEKPQETEPEKVLPESVSVQPRMTLHCQAQSIALEAKEEILVQGEASEIEASITYEKGMGQLTPQVYPQNAEDVSVTYRSSNPEIVNVSQDGEVTALREGTAVITVSTVNQKTARCEVTVEWEEPDIHWSSSDSGIVSVDNGKIEGVGVGSATVTASISSQVQASCAIAVQIGRIYPEQYRYQIKTGEKLSLPLRVHTNIPYEEGSHIFTLWIARLEGFQWEQMKAYYVDGGDISTVCEIDTSGLSAGDYVFAVSLFYSEHFTQGMSLDDQLIRVTITDD